MGEKVAPAISAELLRVKALPDALEPGAPIPATPIPACVSESVPVSSPTNGHAVEVPLPVHKAYFEQMIENVPEAISIRRPRGAHSAHQRRVHASVRLYLGGSVRQDAGQIHRAARPLCGNRLDQREHQDAKQTHVWRLGAGGKMAPWSRCCCPTSPVTLNGKSIGSYASYRDITEQKRAEELNAAMYAIAARSQSRGGPAAVFRRHSQHRRPVDECPQLLHRPLRSPVPIAELPIFRR